MLAASLKAKSVRSMVRYGEGFRMPASRDLSARAEGRRPKASQEGYWLRAAFLSARPIQRDSSSG
jgi:hypothetical protein